MKSIKIYFILIICLSSCYFAQTGENNLFNIGFRYYKTFDTSRQYVRDNDTTFRPLLIHYWYPTNKGNNTQRLSFKNYIDLIAIRDDYNKSVEEVNTNSTNFINAYLGFAKQNFNIDTSITPQNVLDFPVKAIQNAPMIDKSFPLIIYAPSNSKSAIQNFIICETLASNGFNVISVGSAGVNSMTRTEEKSSTEAQVLDMQFILEYFNDSLNIKYSDLGLLGFSSGSIATALFQAKSNNVNAVVSLDGGHEYFSYISLFEIKDFNLSNTAVPYCFLKNNHENISFYPYYNSIISTEKFMFKMPYLNHNGFVSFWKFFDLCSSNNSINSVTKSYDLINQTVLKFFNSFLKSSPQLSNKVNNFQVSSNEYIAKDTIDNSVVASLLNKLLSDGIETAVSGINKKKEIYVGKENEINILARMFLDKDISISKRLFLVNIELHPNSWQAYYNLGICYKKENNLSLAKDALNRAIDLQPNNLDVLKLMKEVSEQTN